MTNPGNILGTPAAFGGRTSPNAFNDVLGVFSGAGILSGWQAVAYQNMTIKLGGVLGVRDVAIAEDNIGNRTTINNILGTALEVTLATASTTSARLDSVVAYVNSPAQTSTATTDNPSAVGVVAVAGTSGEYPDDDAIRAAITADGGTGTTAYYVVLANVTVPQSATVITTNNISQGGLSASIPGSNLLDGSVTSDKIDWSTTPTAVSPSLPNVLTLSQNNSFKIGKVLFVNFRAECSDGIAKWTNYAVSFPNETFAANQEVNIQVWARDAFNLCLRGRTTGGSGITIVMGENVAPVSSALFFTGVLLTQ